jgi:hypothetical protein
METKMKDEKCGAQHSFEIGNPELAFERFDNDDPKLTGRQIIEKFGGSPVDEHLVFDLDDNHGLIEIGLRKSVALKRGGKSKFIVFKSTASYRITLEGRVVEWGCDSITGKALRTLFGPIDDEAQIWMALRDEPDRLVPENECIDLAAKGLERFYLRVPEWKLNVQGVHVAFGKSKVTVREALVAAGIDPDSGWIAVLKVQGEPKRSIGLCDDIDLSAPSIEKLRLTPKEIKNGEFVTQQRREFSVLDGDMQFLSERNLSWDTLMDNGRRWFVLRSYRLPEGYDRSVVDIAIEVPTGYPTAQLDMFYCHPHLQRTDGQSIPTTQVRQQIESKSFQRWSRHRGATNPWNPQYDSLVTQIVLAEESIQREVAP